MVSLTLDTLASADERLARLQGLSPRSLDTLRGMAVAAVGESFLYSRSPDGMAWQPLKARRKSGTSRPLVDTGTLARSIRAKIEQGGLEVFSTADYAGYHQTGTSRIPARPFMGFSEQALARMADAVAKAQARELAAALVGAQPSEAPL